MIDKLNVHAAIAARDGVESAIVNIERRIKIKLDDVNPQVREYFVEQNKTDKEALNQLKDLRAALNKRVFDAHTGK